MLALPLLGLAVWLFLLHPLSGFLLGAVFLAYAAAVWWRPETAFFLLPLFIGLFDLSPWSGWWFFDELDGILLLTLALLLVRSPLSRADFRFSRLLWLLIGLLTASYVISAARVLLPWPGITQNSFNIYLSPFNAVRVGKGFVWILLLLPWMQQAANRKTNLMQLLAAGFIAATFLVSLYVMIERWRLVGLFNLASFYRSIGPFYSMHTGDGHIDVWYAVLTPMLLAGLFFRPRLPAWIFSGGTLLMALYCVISTGSRGPFLAVLAGCGIAALALIYQQRKLTRAVAASGGALVLALVLAGNFALPLLKETYLGKRFFTTAEDATHRETHWKTVLALRDDTLAAHLFGMGLGQFPQVYARNGDATGKPIARYEFLTEDGNTFLRLHPGDPLYFQQLIRIDPKSVYKLTAKVRAEAPNTPLSLPICQKWILHLTHTVDCMSNDVTIEKANQPWQTLHIAARTGNLGEPHWRWGKFGTTPNWFMIIFYQAKAPIDIDDIRLENAQGQNLLKNGDFEHRNNFWFWVSYNHLTHHTKNLAVNILFDRGWLGLAADGLALLLCLGALIRKTGSHTVMAPAWLGAVAGWLVIGITVSAFDAPRLTMIFYLITLVPLINGRARDGTPRSA
jgi:hypothetical protein